MQPKPVRPPKLGPGSRVALITPSGPVHEPDQRARGEALCRALGLEPVSVGPRYAAHGYLAGTDAERLDELNTAIRDPSIDAIWALRGGDGLNRIVAGVDYDAFAVRPKAVIGFSDITVISLALTVATGVVTFHGPVARSAMPSFSRTHFERVLMRSEPAGRLGRLPVDSDTLVPDRGRVVTVRPGRATGPLIGGNLTLLQSLVGTRFVPDLTGAILFLEDVNEGLYRIDRMLGHLRLAGVLDGIAGVAIGHFSRMRRATPDGALGLHDVLRHYFAPLGVPVVRGFPIGHLREQWTLPVGVMAELDADAAALTLLDAAVI